LETSCRLCHSHKQISELIKLKNFPRSAQQLPQKSDFRQDNPIELSIFQCMTCGLVQTGNPPVDYYKDVITAATHTDISKKKIKEEITALITKYNITPSTALEVGSASGGYLEILREMGFVAEGIEHKIESVEESRKKYFKIHRGYLLDDLKIEKKYQFIAINNFLEHQPDITKFLNCVNRLLDDDGLAYISVPNLERITEKHCLYEFVADHLVYFTETTLHTALARTGFEPAEIYKKNSNNDIVIVAQKPRRLNLQKSMAHVETIVRSLQVYIKNLTDKNKKVCVWGAGHRALALMSISNLNSISAVVDSAPFKQGRFTPLLHKKIISPKNFLESHYDAVIIMLPGSYAEQAKNYLDKHDYQGEITLFDDQKIIISH
jgi:2-polyprenyl-3-methyl-5-hydroxy-6-metoxy-1,4-benzoquinol methylase